jgi:hypothetical protein
MFASFQNVLFTFDNSSDNDLAVYEYELYNEDDIVDPNTPPYALKPNPLIAGQYVPPFKSGAGNSSVFAVPVEGSYIDVENNNIVVQKNFFGRVRARDTSGNPGQWTDIKKTDQSTPLIDSQYIVSLTASKIKAGEIESAAITLGGANPAETIIQSKTYVTSSGTSGWYIDGLGEFSLGGPEGINYNGSSITIGSDVQVTANLAADSISVGSGLNQLNINDAINGGAGGMTLGSGGNNYWYTNGSFRVGSATNYLEWVPNPPPGINPYLEVKGRITSTSGRIGPFDITESSMTSIGYAPNNYISIENFGDISIYSSPTSGTGSQHVGRVHLTNLVGEYIVVGNITPGVVGRYAVMGSPGENPDGIEFHIVDNEAFKFRAKSDGTVYASGNITSGSYISDGTVYASGNITSGSYIAAGSTGITDLGSVSASNWFRSSGATGWYNQTYGGGIFMNDTTTVKVYADKNFYTGGVITSFQYNGTTADINSGSNNFATLAIRRNFTNVSDKRFVTFLRASTEVGRIKYVDGNSDKIEYLTTSDKRLKEKIKPIEGALEIISKIEPVSYVFKSGGNEEHGFLAQDMFEVYNKVVSKPLDDDERWMLNYAGMTPLLTAGLKELNDKIIRLEQKIFFLEGKV